MLVVSKHAGPNSWCCIGSTRSKAVLDLVFDNTSSEIIIRAKYLVILFFYSRFGEHVVNVNNKEQCPVSVMIMKRRRTPPNPLCHPPNSPPLYLPMSDDDEKASSKTTKGFFSTYIKLP